MAQRNSAMGDTPDHASGMGGNGIDRRMALGVLGGVMGAAAFAGTGFAQGRDPGAGGTRTSKPGSMGPLGVNELGWDEARQEFTLPSLPYGYAALEPAIDAQTMEIHHGRHHAGYVRGLNTALKALTAIRAGEEDPALVKHWSRELSFHGGGHINHALFWQTMAPANNGGGGQPGGLLARVIQRDFGSFNQFKAHFTAAANAVEASGWAWLVLDRLSGRLMIQQMEKQQNMLLTACVPLLGVDVWEHAYYLRYQNRRGDYVNNWFSVINWARVSEIFEASIA